MVRLSIFLKLWFLEKCLRMSLKNSLPINVLTFKLKGGLNQITCLFWFRLAFWDGFSNFNVAWYPMFLSAIWHVILALLKTQFRHRINLKCVWWQLLNDWWWVVGFWMYIYSCIIRFLKIKFFPVVKLKETSKKSVSMRFVSIVIHSPSSLNKMITSFLNLSTLGALALCIMASPSSLYKLTLLEPKRDLILFRRYNPTNHSSFNAHYLYLKDKPLSWKSLTWRFQCLIKIKIGFVILWSLVTLWR